MAKKIGGLGKGLNAIFMENESEDKNNTVVLKISEIEPNASQPRHEFNEKALEELAESIKAHGILQPLLVRPIIGGGYEIVAGERRYRACRMAGVTEVPVVIREISDSETMELALIENLQRENLSSIEEAEGYRTLIETHGFSQEEIAKSVGKSRPAVANALRLLNLPDKIKDVVAKGLLSAGHARALLSLEDTERMITLMDEIINNDYSVRQVEKLIKENNKEKAKKEESNNKQVKEKNKYYSEAELALTEYLGKKVIVQPFKNNKEGGILSIEFYSNEELEDLANKLEDKEGA